MKAVIIALMFLDTGRLKAHKILKRGVSPTHPQGHGAHGHPTRPLPEFFPLLGYIQLLGFLWDMGFHTLL